MVSNLPTSKLLPFRRAKMMLKCTSAEQFTGQWTIGDPLLLKKGLSQTKSSRNATSDSPQYFSEVTSLILRLNAAINCIL